MKDKTLENLAKGEEAIPVKDLFMMCRRLNFYALSALSDEYHVRTCREDELDVWKKMPFDDPIEAEKNRGYMTDYFANVYAKKGNLFFEKCLFVCDGNDNPVATAFIWKAYDEFSTVHWVKVLKEHEGKGIGRALLSIIMNDLDEIDYPVYLHTHPSSFRAIKLYSDFGFNFLSDPIIGRRKNDIEACWPILEKFMPDKYFKNLRSENAPEYFIKKLGMVRDNQF